MANSITKVARIIGLTGLVGAVSLAGVRYTSQYDSIQDAIDGLKDRALDWKDLAGTRQGQLDKLQGEYDTLEANYKAILDILNIQDGEDIEVVKDKVQEIYNNATSTGIEGTNQMLQSIANALGIELTDSDMNENGVYKVQKILDELETLDNELDKLDEAIGDLVVNLDAGDMEYREDMSLTEKINYLIGQINVANNEQATIKTYAEDALNSVEAVPGGDEEVTEPSQPDQSEPEQSNPEVTEPEQSEPTLEEQLAEAEADMTNKFNIINTSSAAKEEYAKVLTGENTVVVQSNVYKIKKSNGYYEEIGTSTNTGVKEFYQAYQTWRALYDQLNS